MVIDADTGTRIWHGLCDAAGKEVAAHSAGWATVTGLRQGKLAEATLQTPTVEKLSSSNDSVVPDLFDMRKGEGSCSAD
ncbi:hypothetical protein ACIOEX_10200 [Streptomyces sp. NPDC087850]|uniref:hypothetical protein n=1 Tax=Streptomyces sp. NPDC087850 TaxID=3365809 RepID=UPI0038217C75